MSKVKIDGAAELEKTLRLLPKEIAKKVVYGALLKGAQPILDEARRRAPVGNVVRKDWKGRLHLPATLKWSIRKFRAKTAPGEPPAVAIGIPKKSRAFYAHMVEFGTRKMRPRPFLRPAFDAKGMEALSIIGREIGKGIERAVKRLARQRRKR